MFMFLIYEFDRYKEDQNLSVNLNNNFYIIILTAYKVVQMGIVIPLFTEVCQIGIITKSVIDTQARSDD